MVLRYPNLHCSLAHRSMSRQISRLRKSSGFILDTPSVLLVQFGSSFTLLLRRVRNLPSWRKVSLYPWIQPRCTTFTAFVREERARLVGGSRLPTDWRQPDRVQQNKYAKTDCSCKLRGLTLEHRKHNGSEHTKAQLCKPVTDSSHGSNQVLQPSLHSGARGSRFL